MKYIKYILGALATLVILFFLAGIIRPKLTYEVFATANKPLDESWAVSQDDKKMSDWLEGFQKIEHISGSPGTVGAVSDIYFVSEGQEMIIRETITEIVPKESISMLFTSDFMDMEYQLNMRPYNGKTELISKTTCKGNGMFSKSLIALTGNSIIAQEEKNLIKLKETIEKNLNNYSNTEN